MLYTHSWGRWLTSRGSNTHLFFTLTVLIVSYTSFFLFPVHLTVCLSVGLSVCLPVRLPTCLHVCLPAYLPVCLPVFLSVCVSIYLYIRVDMIYHLTTLLTIDIEYSMDKFI
jgi:hypothetical protein